MKSGSSGGRLGGLLVVLALVVSGLIFMAAVIDEFSRRGFEYVILALLGEVVLFSVLTLGPVGRAIAGLLEGNPSNDDTGLAGRVADLEDRMIDISGEVQRLGEMEARVEFAERLLARPMTDMPKEER